tara:strand:+ start:1574 stop:2326 length:753 start_codon:yes stop_codon:yes gene_type:complete
MNKLFSIIILLYSYSLISQESKQEVKEESDILLSISHILQIPAGNLANRFGNNSDISVSMIYKNKRDFVITLEGGIIFGPNVKEDNIFESIDGNNGFLISQNGEIPIIRLFERGGHVDVNVGKYFQLVDQKHESGILLSIGLGYLYHKIFIETIVTELPQLNEELLKGYDRLCGGLLIKQFIGYLYFSKKNNIRFLLGIETIQGFTKDLREYNYTTQTYVNQKRVDHLIGLKSGFIIPIKKRNTGKYYYY